MNREKLLQLRQENRENPVLYSLLGVIIGECDRVGKDLSENQIIIIIKKMIKNNLEILSSFEDNSFDSLDKSISLQTENEFLQQFIPQQLTEEEILEIIVSRIQDSMSLGEIMKHFKDSYNGRYDGKLVSTIIKQELNKTN